MRLSPSCRDKGRGGVDEGALCLSWLGCDPLASRNPNDSKSEEDKHKAQYITLKAKRGKEDRKAPYLAYSQKAKKPRSFLMYRLRQLDVDDKVCEQVEMTLLAQVYPPAAIERCVGQSQPWASKARRVRQSTLLALVLFVIGMALWSRLNQRLVWDKLVGKLSALQDAEPQSQLNASALSGRRQELGSQGLQALLHTCCRVLAQPQTMPSAFFGRYRLMAIDGTVFNTADTQANEAAFGRSSNQYGKGAYPQVRCVLLAECGSHAVVELEISRYDGSEVHGAHRLLDELGRDTLVLVDAGIISGGFLEHARQRRVQVLGALEAGVWEHLPGQRRLADGSILVWVPPTCPGQAHYPVQHGLWVRILSYQVTDERLGEVGQVYRLVTTLLNPQVAPALDLIGLYHERWEVELVIDEIKTHERVQRKVLRSKTPEGVRKATLRDLFGPLRGACPDGASRGGGRTGPGSAQLHRGCLCPDGDAGPGPPRGARGGDRAEASAGAPADGAPGLSPVPLGRAPP